MIFQEDAAAGAQIVDQVRVEILPELRTGGATGIRHGVPDTRPGGFERAIVHVFVFHCLESLFQTVFGHDRAPSLTEGLRPSDSPTRFRLRAKRFGATAPEPWRRRALARRFRRRAPFAWLA